MTRNVTIAVTQMACGDDLEANCDRAEKLVREASAKGAQVVLIQELFEGPYFCKEEHAADMARATPFEGHPTIARFSALARELGAVIPVSFYERDHNALYNSLAMIDADGTVMGRYRKSHIPHGPGYEEKFFFNPGDTGFKVWNTAHGTIGVGVCWDQWFPETARAMALMGAEILLYPTAIGSEPASPGYDSSDHWQTAMRGHAAANLMPLAAANRIGREVGPDGTDMTFYGRSFIAGWQGEMIAEADRDSQCVLTATFDLDHIRDMRLGWGIFRDRRPDLYGPLLTLDGQTRPAGSN